MIGKVNDDFFQRNILTSFGKERPQVVIGPAMGVDAAILKTGDGYLAIAEDPIFPSMNMSPDDFGFLTVHIGASDVAVMGIKPQFMTYSLLLPPGTAEEYINALISSISKYAAELGIAIVGGHTGFYGAVTVPTIGGITVWGTGHSYVSPKGAREKDNIIITKGAGVEGAALLAYECREALRSVLPEELVNRAVARMREISVVREAMIAAGNHGVHAMHDATEGGVKRGLWEIGQASAKGIRINKDKLLIPEDIKAVCEYFRLDPWEIISEGTLLLTCDPVTTEELLTAYRNAGIPAQIIGEVTSPEEGCVFQEQGRTYPLVPPAEDKFWEVFFNSATILRRRSQSNNPGINWDQLCRELQEAVNTLCRANIGPLLPEIGANIAYAAPDSKSLAEVAGIPGRIIKVKGKAVAISQPELGASTYMGNTLLTVRNYFPECNCVMNLRNDEAVLQACRRENFQLLHMPTPEGYHQSDADFYRDLKRVLENCPGLPEIIGIPDRLNLEKLILVLGRNLPELIAKVLRMNRAIESR